MVEPAKGVKAPTYYIWFTKSELKERAQRGLFGA